jgi:nitrite reductase/ring-hydroxylating ferredoxin subunit
VNEMSKDRAEFGGERSPGMTYTEMLERDSRAVPDFLFEESTAALPYGPITADRYIDPAFAKREAELMWPNVWQFAAREEDMPDAGDSVVYEINDKSFLLVRQTDGEVKAFYNACLHRGRKLKTEDGTCLGIRCPFHGFTWNNDGSFREVPNDWDFKHVANEGFSLPELRVNRWQGFIMITENASIPDFAEWVGPAVAHYDRWRLDECSTVVWIGRVIDANWKVVSEAFMEAYHSVTTHPQLLAFLGDCNTRYDVYGDFMNRAITPSGVLSPHVSGKDQNYVLQKFAEFFGDTSKEPVPRSSKEADVDSVSGMVNDDPTGARKVLADANRAAFKVATGRDYSEKSDSEMLDNLTYNIFPNFSPWGGFMPTIVYRWRPWGGHDRCLMEVRFLLRRPEGAPVTKGADMFLIAEGGSFKDAAHLVGEGFANVLDQDESNLKHVQTGMHSLKNGKIELANYQDIRIRQFANTMDKFLNGQLPE